MSSRPRSYPVARVLAVRDELTALWLSRLGGQEVSGAALDEAVSAALGVLPQTVDPRAVRDSLVDLLGRPLARPAARACAWRLAGNLHRLRAGLPAAPWSRQEADEWLPAEVAHAERGPRPGRPGRPGAGEPGAAVSLVLLAGPPAGLTVRRFWGNAFAGRLRGRLGFDRHRVRPASWPDGRPFCPYQDPLQLCGLRLALLLTPASCPGRPDYERVAVPSSQRARNRALILKRGRHGFACPRGLAHPCHRCPLGRELCPAACRPATLAAGPCPRCGRPDAPFDPASPGPACLACRARQPARSHPP